MRNSVPKNLSNPICIVLIHNDELSVLVNCFQEQMPSKPIDLKLKPTIFCKFFLILRYILYYNNLIIIPFVF